MKLLLIGMGPGNGLSIARRFGKEGFEILMVARSAEKLAEWVSTLSAEGINARAYSSNIADTSAFSALLGSIVASEGNIDLLHYNASAYNPARPSEIQLPVFLDDLNVNITGALLAAQAVFPAMRDSGNGTMFFTGGGTAFKAPAMLASLGVGKAGMRNLAFSIAEECAPLGIRVATVTIAGMVQPGTRFDPDNIAEQFWQMYQQPKENWTTEVVWE
jgi:NAD(P)-dependent dehydrogenase (short-subunit alcohol dehydrogenase family)